MQGFWLLPCNCLERQRALKPDKRACKGAVQGACGPVRCVAGLCRCQANCIALHCIELRFGLVWLCLAGLGLVRVVRGAPFAQGGGRESPRRARPFSLSPQRKGPKERRPDCLRPFALLRATCGARVQRGLARTRLRLRQSQALVRWPLCSSAQPDGRLGTSRQPTANSQQPTANSQQPTAKNQKPKTKNQKPKTKNQNSGHRCARDWSLAWLSLPLEKGRGEGQRRWKKKKQSRREKAAPLQKRKPAFYSPSFLMISPTFSSSVALVKGLTM